MDKIKLPKMKTRSGDYSEKDLRKLISERTPPVEMHKNLELVEQLKRAGINFVPIPVFDDEDKSEMISKLYRRLGRLLK